MSVRDLLKRYVYVHKCAGCGEILDYSHCDNAFCQMCQLDWNAAIVESCAACMKPARECSCMPKLLERSGALALRRMFFYKSESARSPSMSTIFWLKYKKSRRIVRFVGENIAELVREELSALGEEAAENTVITNAPRSLRSLREIGYDQSAEVARQVAALTSMKYERVFSSVSKKQKQLNAGERKRNAEKSIRMENVDVKGKYVILFDDMVTTGASLSACVKLLMKSGAAGVLCFSLASKSNK